MSYELFALRRLRLAIEPSTAYATFITGSSANYNDIDVTEATLGVEVEMLENETVMQRVDDVLPKVNARRKCTLDFTTYLKSTGGTNSIGSSLTFNNAQSMLALRTVMGATSSVTTRGITAISGNNDGVTITGTNGYLAGHVVGILNPTSSQLEATRVTNATGQNVAFEHKLGFTPTSGSALYTGITAYLTQDPNESMQFYVVGAESDDTWYAQGLNGGMSLTAEIGQLPKLGFTLAGANWSTGSTDTIGIQPISNSNPIPLVDGFVTFYPRSSVSTFAAVQGLIDVQSIEITPAVEYLDIMTERGVNNILRKRRNRVVPVATGKFVTYYQDKTYFTARDASTIYGLQLQIGNTVGNTVVVSCPRVKITNTQIVDAGGLMGVEVSFDCLEDSISTVTSNNTDLARSAFTITYL